MQLSYIYAQLTYMYILYLKVKITQIVHATQIAHIVCNK